MTEIFAPAKVNLSLHVTGRRDDGYHLLDSLVCFPDIGDSLVFEPSDTMRLSIEGAPELETDNNNLVMRAAQTFLPDSPHQIKLIKRLPISSGIGGGSADAAGVIRYAQGRSDVALDWTENALKLGADVPVCVASRPQRFRGIGQELSIIETWPEGAYILLVNPRVPVSTPAIFAKLSSRENASMPDVLPEFQTLDALVDFLHTQRNDLQAPAIEVEPVIARVLEAIESTDACRLARMSGSGATCFGIFGTPEAARAAADRITRAEPDWWVRSGALQCTV